MRWEKARVDGAAFGNLALGKRHGRTLVIFGAACMVLWTIYSFLVPQRVVLLNWQPRVWHVFAGNTGIQVRYFIRWASTLTFTAIWIALLHSSVRPNRWRALALWVGPLMLALPVISGDLYNYVEQGWAILNGANPYVIPMGATPGPFSDWAGVWGGTTVGYPPLGLVVNGLVTALTSWNPVAALLAARLPAIVGLVFLGAAIRPIAGRLGLDDEKLFWFAVLNPAVLMYGVWDGHNDLLAIGLGVYALAVAITAPGLTGFIAAAVLVGIAAALKQPALAFALPACWFSAMAENQRLGIRTALVSLTGIIATAVAALPGWITGWGLGWLNATGVPGQGIAGPWLLLKAPIYGWVAAHWPMKSVSVSLAAVALGIFIVALWFLARGSRSARGSLVALVWAYTALWFLGPYLMPWYLLWILVPCALLATRNSVVLVNVFLTVWLVTPFIAGDVTQTYHSLTWIYVLVALFMVSVLFPRIIPRLRPSST